MARPKCEINEQDFMEYYRIGYNDCQIAEKLGISRMTAARKRSEMQLGARYQKGWRGISMRSDEPYWRFAQRVFIRYPELARRFRHKAQEFYLQGRIDFPTYFVCLGTEPGKAAAFQCRDTVRMKRRFDFSSLNQVIEFEKQIEYSGMAGVPGPELIDLVQVIRTASSETLDQMIEASILNAGLVNINACLGHSFICYPVSSCSAFWETIKAEGQQWLKHLASARNMPSMHDTSSGGAVSC